MPVASRASDLFRAAAGRTWEAQHEHPFVRGIGDGTLAPESFARYLRQDYVFLVDYARLLALGAARAPDLATMRRFADLAQAILGEEMEAHRTSARELGITEADLEAEEAAPVTAAYADFLLRTATLGDVAELAAALLPCMWGYHDVGARLADRAAAPAYGPYARWIALYAGADFARLTDWCRALVDDLAQDAGPRGRARMAAAFATSSRHELAFWDVGL